MAADGTPWMTWHGKDFAATTEIVKLGDVKIAVQVPDLSDPWLRGFYAALVAWERIEGANRIAPAHVLETVGCRFIQKGGTIESWHQYETELGVTKSKTRPPRSLFQPFIKWARGGRNDTDGSIGRLAAAFDAWLALGKERRDPTPQNGEPGTSQLAELLAEQHGYQEVAKAHNARLEYEAALKRGTIWVTHADGTERIYDTKAAGESQNEGPGADAAIGVQRHGRLRCSSQYEISSPCWAVIRIVSAFFGTNIVSKKLHRRRVGRLTISAYCGRVWLI